MPTLKKGRKVVFFPFEDSEVRELGLEIGKNYSFHKAGKGLYVVTASGPEEREGVLEKKIFGLLEKKRIEDRVEGRFEKTLNSEELEKFKEMLAQGKIEKYKSSDKYVKSLYMRAGEGKPCAQIRATILPSGFIATNSEQEARELSDSLQEEMKAKKVKGIKDFDGTFYVLEQQAFEAAAERIRRALEKKNCSLGELAKTTGLERQMVKGVCALLKEDGELLEKHSGSYEYIK